MIIPDTSIWIEFYKAHEPYYQELKALLEKREVVGLSVVFGELLQGVKNANEKKIILDYWNFLPKIDETDLLIIAGTYTYENKLISKGVGLIDASIVIAAIGNNAEIWTLDEKLKKVLKREYLH